MKRGTQALISFATLLSLCPVCRAEFDVEVTYDPLTGNVSFASEPGVAFMWVVSDSGQFSDTPIENVFFHTPYVVNFLTEPVSAFDLGPLLPPGLSRTEVADDLCIEAGVKRSAPRHDKIGLNGEAWITSAAGCQAKRMPRLPVTDPRAVLYYDAATGNLRVDISQADQSAGEAKMTTLEMVSAGSIFTGEPANGLVSPFAVDRDDKIFHHLESGFDDVDFGNVVQTGLTNGEFVADLCVAGSWLGGGAVTTEYQYPGAGTVPLTCDASSERTDLAVVFDEGNGTLAIHVDAADDPNAAHGLPLSTLEIRSAEGIFTGLLAGNLDGPYDAFDEHLVLKQDPDGFATIDFGPIVKPGTTLEMLVRDLTFDLTTVDGSLLGKVMTVPEPSSRLALWLSIAALLVATRQQ